MRTEMLLGSFGENFHSFLHYSDMKLVVTHCDHSIRIESYADGSNRK